MVAAPPVIETEISARVPDRLRARENVPLQSGVGATAFSKQSRPGRDFHSDVGRYGAGRHGDRRRGRPCSVPYRDGIGMAVQPARATIGRNRSCAGISTSNTAYGGPERRTLCITESETGTILAARLEVPGKEIYSHM